MKRFIRYLYEYEQGKRIRNAGFVKIEAGDEETIVNMQGKGFHNSNERKLVLYLFYEKNGKLIGMRQAEVNLVTPVLSQHLVYTVADVGGLEKYSKINGIIVEAENGKRFAVSWDDKPVDVSRMEEEAPEASQDCSDRTEAGREEERAGRSVPENTEYTPQPQRPKQQSEQQPEQQPEQVNRRSLKKIRRQDLARLPRCEWKLANNQFLIYGYNNYHHLVWIQEGNVLKIGVPGIYHIKEAKVAETFGFGEFLSVAELDISLEPEERHQDEPFGYWCRNVRKPQDSRCAEKI